MFHGRGTFTLADGAKYVGKWKDGRMHGEGIHTSSDGKVRTGIWKIKNLAN